jgi:hypothetical protein
MSGLFGRISRVFGSGKVSRLTSCLIVGGSADIADAMKRFAGKDLSGMSVLPQLERVVDSELTTYR